jgi:hypothetical protein
MTMRSPPPSPRRFGHARDLTLMGKFAKTDATQHKSAKYRPLAAAPLASRVPADTELLTGPLLLLDQRLLCHSLILVRSMSLIPRVTPR